MNPDYVGTDVVPCLSMSVQTHIICSQDFEGISLKLVVDYCSQSPSACPHALPVKLILIIDNASKKMLLQRRKRGCFSDIFNLFQGGQPRLVSRSGTLGKHLEETQTSSSWSLPSHLCRNRSTGFLFELHSSLSLRRRDASLCVNNQRWRIGEPPLHW